jgi:hypothetical protein
MFQLVPVPRGRPGIEGTNADDGRKPNSVTKIVRALHVQHRAANDGRRRLKTVMAE